MVPYLQADGCSATPFQPSVPSVWVSLVLDAVESWVVGSTTGRSFGDCRATIPTSAI